MKKIHRIVNKFNLLSTVLLSVYLFVFNVGCGLEEYIIVAAPKTIESQPEHNASFDLRDFKFSTYELKCSDVSVEDRCDSFTGTDIYYKIYNNYNNLLNERSRLENLANDTEQQEKTYSTMTDSYKFKQLKCSDYNKTPLIPATTDKLNQKVHIRLTDYYDIEEWKSVITVDGKPLSETSKPVRNDGKSTFNFGQSGINDSVPGEDTGLDDYSKVTDVTEEGVWYVSMFAVGVALDSTLTPYHSNILYLGCVDIKENSNEN